MIAEPNILDFHREVLHSINQYGQPHKLGIMLGYKARGHDGRGSYTKLQSKDQEYSCHSERSVAE